MRRLSLLTVAARDLSQSDFRLDDYHRFPPVRKYPSPAGGTWSARWRRVGWVRWAREKKNEKKNNKKNGSSFTTVSWARDEYTANEDLAPLLF